MPRRPARTLAVLLLALATAAPASTVASPAVAGDGHADRLAEIEAPFRIAAGPMRTTWVDPVAGDDGAAGTSRATAVRTLAEAWARIPAGPPAGSMGTRILIAPGRIGRAGVPTYMEARHGTAASPIVIRAAQGPGTVTIAPLNVFDVHHLYLDGISIDAPSGDGFHCERCDHILLRRVTVRGRDPGSWRIGDLVKVNQSSSIFIERSDLSGASDNALDLVAVRYASVRRTRIHDAQDWCAYAKGGSAFVRVVDDELYDCGTGGFTAGQGTGFQFMEPPFLHYEAYDVVVANSLIHDIDGAGLGVNGGFGIVFAHNTLTRVGSRSHLLELVAGGRSCDGAPGDDGRERCARYLELGGWGTTRVDDGTNFVRIPNRHVYVVRNLIVNRTDRQVGWQHLEVAGPYGGAAQHGSNAPDPARFDEDLRFIGNLIWSGPADEPLGVGEGTGCAAGSSCAPARILADNLVNVRPVRLTDRDLRIADSSGIAVDGRPIPAVDWSDAPAGTPAGGTAIAASRDRDGLPRPDDPLPGAYR